MDANKHKSSISSDVKKSDKDKQQAKKQSTVLVTGNEVTQADLSRQPSGPLSSLRKHAAVSSKLTGGHVATKVAMFEEMVCACSPNQAVPATSPPPPTFLSQADVSFKKVATLVAQFEAIHRASVSSGKSILDLPFDGPMLRIFDLLPLRDLLQMNKVCTRFAVTQKMAFFSRQSVTVWCILKDQMGGLAATGPEPAIDYSIPFENELLDKDGKRIVRASLRMPQLSARYQNKDWIILTAANAKWLASLLPNVLTLECFISWSLIESLEPLNCILKAWSNTLVTLSVWSTKMYCTHYPNMAQVLRDFLDTINLMTSLKQLVLDLDVPFARIDMSIVSRLESFYFFGNRLEALFPSLQKLSTSQTVSHVGLNARIDIETLMDLSIFSHDFANKIVILKVEKMFSEDFSQLRLEHFANLTTLELDLTDGFSWPNLEPTDFSTAQLAKSLIVLPNLVHLKLEITQPLQVSTEPIPQLDVIKVISIRSLWYYQATVESLQLHKTVPNIMAIKFDYTRMCLHMKGEECRCLSQLKELLYCSAAKRIEIRSLENVLISEKRS